MFGKNILTNTNKRSIIINVNKIQTSEQEKDLSTSYRRCWRTSDIEQVFIHTHKFVDQKGREFDIVELCIYIITYFNTNSQGYL